MKKPDDIRLLVVDDEPDLRETIRDIFVMFGFNVEEAENGDVAWKKMQAKHFDIILTDMRMPVLDGMGLLKKINEESASRQNVLVSSGYSDYPMEEILNLGGMGLLAKPLGALAIRDTISRCLMRSTDRWRISHLSGKDGATQRRFLSLRAAVNSKEISFGRGGFYLRCKGAPLACGLEIKFSFSIVDRLPVSVVEGVGIVRWAHDARGTQSDSAIGVEILSLPDNCRDAFCHWLDSQNLRSFIPLPTKT